MCFDSDSTPPIPAVSGGSVDHRDLVLTGTDGNRFAAFEAGSAGDVAVVVLPDVRGLSPFYEELALRFAERGIDALAIDYFGRTAPIEKRPDEWDCWPHVHETTLQGLRSDVAAAIDHLRGEHAGRPIVIVGFCFGGSNSWHMAAADLGVAGAVGFYGHPDRPDFPSGAPPVVSELRDVTCPLLALQGGADPGIPPEANSSFRDAIAAAGVDGEVVEYPGAPHSFFDRKYEEYGAESADAWGRVLAFIDRAASDQ